MIHLIDTLPLYAQLVLGVLAILGLLDGLRAIFRGTRDHLIATDCSRLLARLAATVAAAGTLVTGIASLVGLISMIGRGRRALQPSRYRPGK